MAKGGDPDRFLNIVSALVLFVGGVLVVFGLIAALFEVPLLRDLGLGWGSIVFGIIFLLIVRGFVAIRDTGKIPREGEAAGAHPSINPTPQISTAADLSTGGPPSASSAVPKSVSFVGTGQPIIQPDAGRADVLSKSLTPEILNLRFVAYRCEIAPDYLKAIYQNATQKEFKWLELSSLVIRQFPFQEPWEGKLLLDIIPNIVAGEKAQPIRILSTTYVNYGSLPQGQATSTKENIRRLASHILSQNRSIFVDPGTDYFVHAGQPPVRFLSMSQFVEYDSRYG
ncbi:hypothetical protein L0156_13185 [bacterium]|nr:hypothetical protein [bacterium]